MNIWITILIVIAVIGALVLLEIYRENHTFRMTYYDIMSEKLKRLSRDLKVVFLSDMHNNVYGSDNQKLYDAIAKEKPDLILVGGDMLVGKPGRDFAPALAFVKKLPAICPVYYANGNHEQRMKEKPEKYDYSYKEYKRLLEESGVIFVENEFCDVEYSEQKIRISGLEIPQYCYKHFGKEEIPAGDFENKIGKCDKEKYQILLAHNPSYMKEYLEWGADLILSGHLHGGIVRIPGITGVISPSFELFPHYSGDHYKEKNRDIVVSKGLGVHTIPIRLFNPAEVIVLKLRAN